MGFTEAELAEMARADAEIEASFEMEYEDYVLQRELDREATFDNLPKDQQRRVTQQRAYRAANKDKVAAQKRAYYAANKDKVAAQQRAYRAANKDKVAAQKRAYYAANKDKVAAQQRAYRAANKDKVAAQKRIAEVRKAHGMTQKALAELIGVTPAAVSLWESCKVPANWDKLRAIFPELVRPEEEDVA